MTIVGEALRASRGATMNTGMRGATEPSRIAGTVMVAFEVPVPVPSESIALILSA
jgi:hypothetical protein